MKKINFLSVILISFILLFKLPFVFSADEEPPIGVFNAALEGMKTFLKDYHAQKLNQIGFANQNEVNDAILSKGFRVFTLHPDSLKNLNVLQDLSSIATPTNLWQFIILTHRKAASLLTVDNVNNKWTAVSIGSFELSKQLNKFIETWPASKGYQYRLIRVYQATSDFMELLYANKVIGIIPLTSGRIAMNLEKQEFDPFDLHTSSDILVNIRPIVKKNIETSAQ